MDWDARPQLGKADTAGPPVRVVVLCPPGLDRPGTLLRALERRGVAVRVVEHAAQAIVGLGDQPGAGALIVQEPEHVGRLGELLGAVRRYFPGVVVRGYRAGGGGGAPRLTVLEEGGGPVEPGPCPARAAARSASAAPRLALAGSPVRPAAVAVEPLISKEEMAMLLGPLERGADPVGPADLEGVQ